MGLVLSLGRIGDGKAAILKAKCGHKKCLLIGASQKVPSSFLRGCGKKLPVKPIGMAERGLYAE